MDAVLALADWDGFAARRARGAASAASCRGIGVANYVDTATGVPRERAEITVQPDGCVDVVLGTVSNGQGHETSFAQLVTEWLGVPIERRAADHRRHRHRVGRRRHPFGPRHAARQHRHRQGVRRHRREGHADRAASARGGRGGDIEFRDGRFVLEGTDRSVGLFEVGGGGARAQRPARRSARPARGDQRRDRRRCRLPLWLPRLRGRDRSRHRRRRDRALLRGRRRRPRRQSDDHPRPDPWRHRAGRRARRCSSTASTSRDRPAARPARSWTTRCRAPTCCRSSTPRSARCRRRPIRSASGRPAKAAPRRRSRWSSTRSSTRSPEFGVTHIEMPATPERVWRAIHGRPDRSRSVP